MTAEELITAASHCLHCGREHDLRTVTDHRGIASRTLADPGDGHQPLSLAWEQPGIHAALKRIADAAESHADAPPASRRPEPAPRRTKPPASRTAPRRATSK